MGVTKLDIHSDAQIAISEIAKVLAHPARVAILDYISKNQQCICDDISSEIGLAQATISQHLQVIRKAGLLKGTFEGKRYCYCLNTERFLEFQQLMNHYFDRTSARCC